MGSGDKQSQKIGKGKPGPGRPKGMPNKLTRSAKEAFQYAFDKMGGADKLAEWAAKNPDKFYQLFAKLIPVDLNHAGKIVVDNAGFDRLFADIFGSGQPTAPIVPDEVADGPK